MKKLICILISLSAGLQLAAAAGATPAASASDKSATAATAASAEGTKPEQGPATIELKNRSSFALEPNSRNPFWPIGWKPVAKQTTSGTEQATGPEISPTAFVISSIIMDQGSRRFAIINGKPMQEGQVFGLQMGSQVYQITVKTIEDGQVILQRRDQEFAVPLRRK